MSVSDQDLVAIARNVAGAVRAGEQLEAYVVRSRETEVKVFNGEVESLSVAEVAGIGQSSRITTVATSSTNRRLRSRTASISR